MKIEIKNIKQTYTLGGGLKLDAINGINLDIRQGEFVGIIGPTGSGKTTLIEHFNALITPSKGSVEYTFYNEDKKKMIKKSIEHSFFHRFKKIKDIRKRIGLVFQFAEYQIFEETIEKEICFGPINMGISKERAKKIASELIEVVGLPKEFLLKSPFEISGGQKRRVALASILAMSPDFLVFDEPTVGLDPQGAQEIMEIFEKLNQKGKTIIIVTHDLDNVLQYAKRCVFLKDGKKIYDGKTYNILNDVKFLEENNMQPPILLQFKNKLLNGKKDYIGQVNSIEELAKKINKRR